MSILLSVLLACTGPVPDPTPDTDTDAVGDTSDTAASGEGALRWEPLDLDGTDPRWGTTSVGGYGIGGVDATMSTRDEVFSVEIEDGELRTEVVATLQTARYCGCAMHDPGRDELVVIGGRNAGFSDEATVEIVDLEFSTSTLIDGMGAADAPVGCWAAFSEAEDRGYVFGGLGGMAITGDTWRWDPSAGSFTELEVAGPSPRYDPGVVTLPDGGLLLVGGMDASMTFEDSPVWRFDPATETWTELTVTSDTQPPGRRFPFVGLTPDGTTLLYGYGSDSPQGRTVRRDLWAFALDTGVWTKLQPDGDRPVARAFAGVWPGPEGSLGVMAFGVDGDLQVHEDAWVLWPE